MKRSRKSYDAPRRPWDKERIIDEKKISREYGLRRKKEIWRAQSILRNFRKQARLLAANVDKDRERILIDKLIRMGILSGEATLDSILALKIEDVLNRRLQTIVMKRGLANTPKQARQFIVHGHILIDGRKTTWPSALVVKELESKIGFKKNSNVHEWLKEEKANGKTKSTKK